MRRRRCRRSISRPCSSSRSRAWSGSRTAAPTRAAFALGWSFGFGFFVAGLYWIGAALLVDVAQFGWLLPFAVLGVPAGLAIFTALALLASHVTCDRLNVGGTPRILVLVACWAAAEWLRGHVLTGFPWNLIGYAWSGDFPGGLFVLQAASSVGIYGLSLLTVLAASLPARFGDLSSERKYAPYVAVVLVAALAAGGAVRLGHDEGADRAGHELCVSSSPRSRRRSGTIRPPTPPISAAMLALTGSPAAVPPKLVIWPEAGAPPFLERDAAARRAIAAAIPRDAIALVGTVRTDPPPLQPEHVWNSLEAIDAKGDILASYDKSHLVPFGEYVPLRSVLPINKITPGTIDFSAGPGPRTIALAGVPPFSPLICYEAIFPGAVVDESDRPDWLLNITNDAWYGYTSGPFQHFAIARMRAVEEGLPLVRDGNNGISGVVDPYGRIVRKFALDGVGVLDAPLPAKLPPTLYAQIGDWGFAGLLLALLAFAAAPRLPRGRRRSAALRTRFPADNPHCT